MRMLTFLSTVAAVFALSLAGCETRIAADGDGVDPVVVPVEDRTVVVDSDRVPPPRREVDADINVTGPRGNGVRVDVDGDRPGLRNDDIDVRVDVDRPILRDRDGDGVRVRETPRGVKVDVRD